MIHQFHPGARLKPARWLNHEFVLVRLQIECAQLLAEGEKGRVGRFDEPCGPEMETVDAAYKEGVEAEEDEDGEVCFAREKGAWLYHFYFYIYFSWDGNRSKAVQC